VTKKLATKVAFFVSCLVAAFIPATVLAKDDINFAYQQNPSSAQFTAMQRNQSIGDGTFRASLLGTSPRYANLSVVPSLTGLYVQVGPASLNTLGSVYVYMPDDTAIFGTGPVALSADPTLIVRQGLLSSPALTLPVPAPSGSGTSIAYLVECTVNRADANPFQYNFINNQNQVTQSTIYHDRLDQVSCMAKASVAAGTPVLPTADAQYVGVAEVLVPAGATATSTGMITQQTQNAISALVQSYNGATIQPNGCFVTGASNICPNGISSGGGFTTVAGVLASPSGINISLCPYTTSCTLVQTPSGTIVTGTVNATGVVSSSGGFSVGSSTISASSEYFVGNLVMGNGIVTAASGTGLSLCANNDCADTRFLIDTNGNVATNGTITTNTGINVGSATTIAPNGITVNGNIESLNGTFETANTGGMAFCEVSACMATLSGTGNLGINGNLNLNGGGTINMGNGLLTSGTINNSGTVNANSVVVGNSVVSPSGFVSGGNVEILTSGVLTAGPGLALSLCSNNNCNTSRFEIDTSGNATVSGNLTLGSGTISSGTGQICAASTCVAPNGIDANGNVNSTSGGFSSNTLTGAASNVPIIFFPGAGSAGKMNLQPNGNLGVTGTVTANGTVLTSSRKMKRDIYDLHDDPLTVVRSIIPRAYNYKTEPKGTPRHIGVIAEDTSPLLAPGHKVFDVGATAMFAGAAAAEADDHVQALARQIRSRSAGSSDPALRQEVSNLYEWIAALAVFTLLCILVLGCFIVYLHKRVLALEK
jgi:hypothetical protein